MNRVVESNYEGITITFDHLRAAFYGSSPLWTRGNHPYDITQDVAYVFKGARYRPVPFELLIESINRLEHAVNILPADLMEPIDFDEMEASIEGKRHTYLLKDGVFIRLRYDTRSDKVHTMKLLGTSEDLEKITEKMGLPHPFDDNRYPFKELFRDSRPYPLSVLG